MKRSRRHSASRPRPTGHGTQIDADAGLPVGHLPIDTVRDEVALQRLAWQATPAGDAGFQILAIVAVVYWVRALVVDLLALISRAMVGMGRRGRGAP